MTAAISITAAGVTPKAVCVLPAGTVTFTNNDTVQHSVQDSGTACPQLNLAAIPASGGTATTAAFPTAMVCQFHDQAAPTDTKFQGTVGVTTGPQPGY